MVHEPPRQTEWPILVVAIVFIVLVAASGVVFAVMSVRP